MAANTTPIYSKAGQIAWGTLTAANTAKDGTGTVVTIFTAGPDGGRVERVRAKALGTNVATVLRIFVNNGSDPTVAANNAMIAEATLAATTLSEVAALTQVEIPTSSDQNAFPLVLPPGYKLTATIGTAVAAGYHVLAIGGSY
jgi:hypothetical protein